jgi:N-methylhydantoinase A
VVLGLIDPDAFLSGTMPLDREAAVRAVGGLAEELGLTVEEAAAGIIRINAHQAATLIRQRTVEQGLDPRDFVLYAFGGAGPVHAFAFAEELGVEGVTIPLGNGASTLSAFGIAASDVIRNFEADVALKAPFDADALRVAVEGLKAEALEKMAELGFAADQVEIEATAMARYAEQLMHATPLPLPERIDPDAAAELSRLFDAEYMRLYGEAALAAFADVEIFSVRVSAHIPQEIAEASAAAGERQGGIEPTGTRDVYWPRVSDWVASAVYDGSQLRPGDSLQGPAVVQLPHTTVTVAAGQELTVTDNLNLVLRLPQAAAGTGAQADVMHVH